MIVTQRTYFSYFSVNTTVQYEMRHFMNDLKNKDCQFYTHCPIHRQHRFIPLVLLNLNNNNKLI